MRTRSVIAGGVLWAVFAGLILCANGGLLRAEVPYVEPNFTVELFNVDALSLDEETRDGIVEVLAAVARNFPHEPAIDNAIRMKALAVALRLDSMNPDARLANDALIEGRVPPPLAPPRDSGEIAGFLWDTAARMKEASIEDADAELVPVLVDLAVAIDPARNANVASVFGVARPGKVSWREIVTLPVEETASRELAMGPGEGSDEGRKGAMRQEILSGEEAGDGGVAGRRIREAILETLKERQGQRAGSLGTRGGEPAGLVAQLKRETNTLGVVVFEKRGESEMGEVAVPCRLTLTVSDGERETELNPFFCEEGIDLPVYAQLRVVARLLVQKYSALPETKRLDFQLTAIEDGRRLRMNDRRLGATALFLMESLLSGVALDPEVSVGGVLPGDETGAATPLPRWGEILEAAARTGVKAVIVEPKAEAELTDYLVAGEFLPLLHVQALGVDAAEEIAAVIAVERDAGAAEAMRVFVEVQEAGERVGPTELVKNMKVHERFEQVLESYPAHLSAKLLLAYGTGMLPEQMSLKGSVRVVESYLRRVARAANPTDTAQLPETQDSVCADSLFALRRLRPKLAAEATEYGDAVVDLIEEVRKYVQLSNRATSTARQLADEIARLNQRVVALRGQFGDEAGE